MSTREWVHEAPAYWDADKQRIIGEAASGIFDARFRRVRAGEMLPAMERLLIGLMPGTHHIFELAADEAFGPYRDELVERVKREHMPDEEIEAMSIMEFTAPDGSRYSGLVREIDAQSALIDFNHPLAGKAIRFEVQVIGIS